MGRPPKTREVIREPATLPKVGEWYINRLETVVDLDKEGNQQTVLSVLYLPVESIAPHGRLSKVTFDHDRAKVAFAAFPANMFMTARETAKKLRDMADMIEKGVK